MNRKINSKGRGFSTNVPEIELIRQVRNRPALYDKNFSEYRKPGVSHSAWKEVAFVLNTSIPNCKKRWKSLRDTFIKYYRIEQHQSSSFSNSVKRKRWHFYNELTFLKPHIELFRLEEYINKNDESSRKEEPIFIKQNCLDSPDEEKNYLLEDEEILNSPLQYQIKFNENLDYEVTTENQSSKKFSMEFPDNEKDEEEHPNEKLYLTPPPNYDDMVLEEPVDPLPDSLTKFTQESSTSISIPQTQSIIPEINQQQRNITDIDELYLLSCLPAFKRFTPQQKAYVRMGIERLFYEVEFENICEPSNKKLKS